MNPFSALWQGLKHILADILSFYGNALGVLEPWQWGFAIVLLTITVRLILVPLAIRQMKSMEGMQAIRPQMEKIQKKYKTDREMMRTDPERYRARQQKMQQEMSALYKEHKVNPVGGCLPLLAQMPVFFALFSVLRGGQQGTEILVPELIDAPWFGISALSALPFQAGFGAIVLIIGMVVTTYFTQKISMAMQPPAEGQAKQMQETMLWVMPPMLGLMAINIPSGALIYWVTSNLWTMGQTWFIGTYVSANAKGRGNSPKADLKDKKPVSPAKAALEAAAEKFKKEADEKKSGTDTKVADTPTKTNKGKSKKKN